ncbi:MAG: ribosome maturation factor RimP [bacterium]
MLIEKIRGKAEEIARDLELNLHDIKMFKNRKNLILRFTISREGGTSIKDCEIYSKRIESYLDQLDVIKERYFLEVQSKGIK